MLRIAALAAAQGLRHASATPSLAAAVMPAALRVLHAPQPSELPSVRSMQFFGGVDPFGGRMFAAAAQPAMEEPPSDDEKPHTFDEGYIAPHRSMKTPPEGGLATITSLDVHTVMAHPVYSTEYLESVKPKHLAPAGLRQHLALKSIQAVRTIFDAATGYGPNMDECKWLRRIIFLETVAGVPGMVAGMLRHLRSLRSMKHDNGWINTLLEEAENERMHLLTFLELRKPGPLFRAMVILAQGAAFNAYFVAYLVSPKFCHAAVGYLEEEAVKTYTHALADIDAGRVWAKTPAPDMAKNYWSLPPDATMRDLVLAVRADEACHSHVNHTYASMNADAPSPFTVGAHEVP